MESPRAGSRQEARQVVATADDAAVPVDALVGAPARLRQGVLDAFGDAREAEVRAELAGVAVDRLRTVSRERLRTGLLAEGGVESVAGVLAAGPVGLERLPGIGPQTATHLLAAAEQIARAVRETLPVRIDVAPGDPDATHLVQTLHTLDAARRLVAPRTAEATAWLTEHAALREAALPATTALGRVFTTPSGRRRARDAVTELAALTARAEASGLLPDARRVAALETTPGDPLEVWTDFRRRSAAYYALLDDVADTGRDVHAAEGHLPAGLVERVEAQRLDTSLLRASLRGYQSFGARYALAQRRVILGDEMGLGKTMQALAVLAHLAAGGADRALVVCPASVLAGWLRELATHTDLPVHALHGPERDAAHAAWREGGGVAVTTFAQLSRLTDQPVDALVVDEAHFVKNPETLRARSVVAWVEHAERVLFLTGTVMENHVEEFRTLVGYLQPDVARAVDAARGVVGTDAFRHAVSPVYLRRNAEDVLAELPELVQVEEWEELGVPDGAAYREAVRAGSFMAMRRAAYAVDHPEDSAKVLRLVELVAEAADNGRKVVVFSYFRDVVDLVVRALGDLAVGPLTGSVPPARRAVIVDDFTTSERPLALVSQIDVGGVGLNLQAASVVILCEPQTKPTTEAQAIARAHRMGQVSSVQVHRLLTVDSVDEHLMTILGTKARLFDAYARRSALAEAVGDAVDVSEADLARTIVAAEQARWGTPQPVPVRRDVEDAPTVER
ncbi:DEAD/DEAH box helicase [Oerskovia flava]|uniref:DEAD/DEAH box helicase n=1 Tax=Oerskovia flava TaxID=2986422 RepID=UPI0022402FF3|nr:DEAD/DEAH box helicase [Oerskovia sp. JB1-3-2]